MKVAFSPRVIVPLVLGVGIIAALLGSSDVGRVVHRAEGFELKYLAVIVLLLAGYQVARAAQWFAFLHEIERNESRRASLMSYMGGELAKALPGGQYFQTYLLRQAQGTPIARSVAATTIIIWLEVVVCLALLLILGAGPWAWVRPCALTLLVGIAAVAVAVKRRLLSGRVMRMTGRAGWLRNAWAWYDDFSASARTLLSPRVLVVTGGLSAAYVLFAAAALWTMAAALGLNGIGLREALVVYAFALCVGLIIPIPIDLGLTEFSGLTLLMAFGLGKSDGLTLMLMQRVISTLLTVLLAGAVLVALRRQVAAALHAEAVGPEPPIGSLPR